MKYCCQPNHPFWYTAQVYWHYKACFANIIFKGFHNLMTQGLLKLWHLVISAMYFTDTCLIILLYQVDYDRRVRPSYGGSPVSVGVSLYVLSISDISEKFMDFTFDMYFRSVTILRYIYCILNHFWNVEFQTNHW